MFKKPEDGNNEFKGSFTQQNSLQSADYTNMTTQREESYIMVDKSESKNDFCEQIYTFQKPVQQQTYQPTSFKISEPQTNLSYLQGKYENLESNHSAKTLNQDTRPYQFNHDQAQLSYSQQKSNDDYEYKMNLSFLESDYLQSAQSVYFSDQDLSIATTSNQVPIVTQQVDPKVRRFFEPDKKEEADPDVFSSLEPPKKFDHNLPILSANKGGYRDKVNTSALRQDFEIGHQPNFSINISDGLRRFLQIDLSDLKGKDVHQFQIGRNMAGKVAFYFEKTGFTIDQLGYRCVQINAGKVQAKQKQEIVHSILKIIGNSDAVGSFNYKNTKLTACILIKENECLHFKEVIAQKFFGLEVQDQLIASKVIDSFYSDWINGDQFILF